MAPLAPLPRHAPAARVLVQLDLGAIRHS